MFKYMLYNYPTRRRAAKPATALGHSTQNPSKNNQKYRSKIQKKSTPKPSKNGQSIKKFNPKSIKKRPKIHPKTTPNPPINDQKSIKILKKSILEAIRAFWHENSDF